MTEPSPDSGETPTADLPAEPSGTPAGAQIGEENISNLHLSISHGDGSLGDLALHPDGKTLAAAGSAGVWLIDRYSLAVLCRLGADLGPALSVAWSANGNRLAAGWHDGSIRLWEWEVGSCPAVQADVLIGHTAGVRSLDWSPDGRRLASGGEDRSIRIWDPISLKNTLSFFHTSAVRTVDWHPGSALLLVGEFDGSISILNAQDGSTAASFFYHDGWVEVVRWSPEGTRVLSAGLDQRLVFWTVSARQDGTIDLQEDLTIPVLFSVETASWTDDGISMYAAGGTPYTIQRFSTVPDSDREGPEAEISAFSGHEGTVEDLILASGGVLITSSQDNSIRVWNLGTGDELRRLDALSGPAFTGSLTGSAWSPDGGRLATTGEDGVLRIWDAATGEQEWQAAAHAGSASAVSWSASGGWIATGGADNFTRVWDSASGELLQEFRSEGGRVNAVAFSPFANQLASGGFFRIAQIWETGTDQPPVLLFPDVEISALGWSSSATLLAIGGSDGSVHLYNMPALTEIGSFSSPHNTPIAGISWEPKGGRLAAMDRRGTIAVWDSASGELLASRAGAGGSWVGLTWSPQGLLAAGNDDGILLFLDALTLEPLALRAGHRTRITDVRFSPDGRSLVSLDAGGIVNHWELLQTPEAGLELRPPEGGFPGTEAAISWPPDGAITRLEAGELESLAVIGRGLASAYDATDRYVSVAGASGVWIYSRADRQPVRYLAGRRTRGAALTQDTRLLAARELQLIRVWDVERTALKLVLPVGLGLRDALSWSPDGSMIADGQRDGRVSVYSALNGSVIRTWMAGAEVLDLSWSRNGSRLAAAAGNEVWLWDIPSGEQIALLAGHEDIVRSVAFNPSGELLLSGSDDLSLRIWSLDGITPPPDADGEDDGIIWPEVPSDSLTSPALTEPGKAAWGKDGEHFYVQQGCCLVLEWGSAAREVQGAIELEGLGPGNSLVLLDDGTILPEFSAFDMHFARQTAVGWLTVEEGAADLIVFLGEDRQLHDFDLQSASPAGLFDLHNHEGQIYNLISDGPLPIIRRETGDPPAYGAAAVYDALHGIWSIFGQPGSLMDEMPDGWTASASPDGNLVAWINTRNAPQTLDIFDLDTEMITSTVEFPGKSEFGKPLVVDLAWSPEGAFMAGGTPTGELVIWDTSGWFQVSEGKTFDLRVNDIAWSPDGSMIAVAGSDRSAHEGLQVIRLVAPDSGRIIQELELDFAHTPTALVFSADGSILVAGDSAGDLLIWDVASWERVAVLVGHNMAVTAVVFSPDGMAIASSSLDGTIRIWGVSR